MKRYFRALLQTVAVWLMAMGCSAYAQHWAYKPWLHNQFNCLLVQTVGFVLFFTISYLWRDK